ncbi:MAG: helical backbone metal receptor, partial [Bacteroidota bacterium]
ITKFCLHPEHWFRQKPRVGGTKQVRFDKVADLKPDLIIGNKEENAQRQIEQLMEEYPVWMSDIRSLEDALTMIRAVGELVDRSAQADQLASDIQRTFDSMRSAAESWSFRGARVAYLIWNAPMMAAASDTFIEAMLQACGMHNVFANTGSRYPNVTAAELQAAKPDLILLSSEPFPFGEAHLRDFSERFPQSVPVLADGEMFSWYGSRLLQSPEHFAQLFR